MMMIIIIITTLASLMTTGLLRSAAVSSDVSLCAVFLCRQAEEFVSVIRNVGSRDRSPVV